MKEKYDITSSYIRIDPMVSGRDVRLESERLEFFSPNV